MVEAHKPQELGIKEERLEKLRQLVKLTSRGKDPDGGAVLNKVRINSLVPILIEGSARGDGICRFVDKCMGDLKEDDVLDLYVTRAPDASATICLNAYNGQPFQVHIDSEGNSVREQMMPMPNYKKKIKGKTVEFESPGTGQWPAFASRFMELVVCDLEGTRPEWLVANLKKADKPQ